MDRDGCDIRRVKRLAPCLCSCLSTHPSAEISLLLHFSFVADVDCDAQGRGHLPSPAPITASSQRFCPYEQFCCGVGSPLLKKGDQDTERGHCKVT